ncbi:MAG: YajQ family cyclic di-GMP-binding protein [Oligoflexia bacterium]|nr:YajQ family cyclic di-GMP-binding protein [Oligoflexia bacterium]
MPSFDVVSELNLQEVDNAINQARKEVATRYDFRGSKAEINLEKDEIKLVAEDEYKLKALREILESKMIKRGVSIKALEYLKEEDGAMGGRKQTIKLINGLSKEKAKEVVQIIKNGKFKAQPAIQDDVVRVTSKSIDELQTVIATLKNSNFTVPLQFTNMRS